MSTKELNVAGPAFVLALLKMTLLVGLILVEMTLRETAGAGPEELESLEGASVYIGVVCRHSLIATTLLGTLGAIAEAAIAVAAGMDEIKEEASSAGIKQMGDEKIGTALNTLAAGFFGGLLSLFIWFALLVYPLLQVINNKIAVGELLQVLMLVIAVILTVPMTTWVVATRHAHRRKE